MSPAGKYMGGLYGQPPRKSLWQRLKALVKRILGRS